MLTMAAMLYLLWRRRTVSRWSSGSNSSPNPNPNQVIEWLNGRLAEAAPPPQAQHTHAHASGREPTPRARPTGGGGGGGGSGGARGGGGGGGAGGARLSLLDCAGFESHLGLRGRASLEQLLLNSCAERLHLACVQHLARPAHAALPAAFKLGGGMHAPAQP